MTDYNHWYRHYWVRQEKASHHWFSFEFDLQGESHHQFHAIRLQYTDDHQYCTVLPEFLLLGVNSFPGKTFWREWEQFSLWKIGIGIRKGILSEIQIWNMERKITRKKHASKENNNAWKRAGTLIAAIEVTSVYHCAKSGTGRFGIK
jgi:hypothetical protein